MAVGGQPLGWVSELSRDYKLLGVSDAMAARLSPVYEKTTLTYRNLGQNGVQALSIRAMLVTRNYTSKSKHDQLEMIFTTSLRPLSVISAKPAVPIPSGRKSTLRR